MLYLYYERASNMKNTLLDKEHKRFLIICCVLIAILGSLFVLEMYLRYDNYCKLSNLYVNEGRI